MALPDLIEIVPLTAPVRAEITVPGSKSITNRALVLAALADGGTTLRGALWSEDTQVMTECLRTLGFRVDVAPDPAEPCNRTITVQGLGGKIPAGGGRGNPLELFVGNAGTAARFLSAMVCLGQGTYRLHGTPRMHERPQSALFGALWQLGYTVDSSNDKLPAVIHGTGPRGGKCSVSIEDSSQFASALLLCAKVGGWKVDVTGENAEESPYVAMTSKLIEAFPRSGGTFDVEPDASSGSYFIAAEKLIPAYMIMEYSEQFGTEVETTYRHTVKVAHWPETGWQADQKFPGVMLEIEMRLSISENILENSPELMKALRIEGVHPDPELLADFLKGSEKAWDGIISRKFDLGDSIMTAIVLAPFSVEPLKFTDLGRLRVQETERVVALRTELTKCGARVEETGDTLEVFPSKLHGAEIETYDDHRMAMCFAVLGLKVPGMKIRNPACVKKTFPNFFQKLADAPPSGLGVKILDGRTGRELRAADLFAE
jgi:3-phosphoshikimate 1-carboxyvinyltransferase